MNEKQLPLPISWSLSKKTDDFVISNCNRYAFEWLEKWPFKIHENFVCLIGEKGSGKTHLSSIWANRMNAIIITEPNDIFSKWYDMLSDANNVHKYFVLDNADEVEDDIMLFYIYNTVKEKNAYLLLTAKSYPSSWDIKLKDVRSRISTINVIRIQRPDEKTMNSILAMALKQRGIVISTTVLQYIANRIERTYESINYWVNKIDSNLIDKKSKPSLQVIKTIIR